MTDGRAMAGVRLSPAANPTLQDESELTRGSLQFDLSGTEEETGIA